MNLAEIVDSVLIEVPGCPLVTIRDAARWAQRSLCERGNAWMVRDEIAVVEARTGDAIVDVPAYAETLSIRELRDGGRTLRPGTDFVMHGTSVKLMRRPHNDELTGTLICRPEHGRDMPDEQLSRWADAVIAGAKYHLMKMPAVEWSNMPMAQHYKLEFEDQINEAKRLSWEGHQAGSIRMNTPRI